MEMTPPSFPCRNRHAIGLAMKGRFLDKPIV